MVMQGSIAVSCQKCGGVADAVAGQEYHRCRFCESLIQLTEVSVDRILPAGVALNSSCPTCARPLQTGLIEGRRVLYCESCFGVVLQHADFCAVVRERAARRAGQEPVAPRPIDPSSFQRQLKCPSCRSVMDVHPYYGPGNIVVDTCADCGLMWLDHGELTRVEQATPAQTPFSVWNASVSPGTEPQSRTNGPDESEAASRSPLQFLADLLF